jgi:hypothetical protein
MEGKTYLSYRSIEGDIPDLSRKWTATEKVDGANLSIKIKGDNTIEFGSRNRTLVKGDNFHNYEGIGEKYKSAILKTATLVRLKHPECKEPIIYAEIYGGYYLHPDVPQIGPGVCKRICYHNATDIVAFDIRLDAEHFLPFEESRAILEEAHMPVVPIVFEVTNPTREDLQERVNKLESVIYERYKWPKIADNGAEGVVLRQGNYLFKVKKLKFEDRPPKHKMVVGGPPPDPAPYINESAFVSALSKLVKKERYDVWNEMRNDVFKSYFMDHPYVVGKDKNYIKEKIYTLLRPFFDGKFKGEAKTDD